MRRGWFFVLVTTITLAYHTVYSQVSYHNFDANSGLPSNEVYFVHQDREGYLWFGTDHGLVKYDGYSFKTYTTADGLTDNTILSFKEDEDGHIWFLTLAGGICFYDGKVFEPHPANDTIKALCKKRFPTSWAVLKNKTIWIGEVTRGFYKITPNGVKGYLGNYIGPALDRKFGNANIYILSLRDSERIHTSLFDDSLPEITDSDVVGIQFLQLTLENFPDALWNFDLVKLNDGHLLITEFHTLTDAFDENSSVDIHWPSNVQALHLQQIGSSEIWAVNKNSPLYSLTLEQGKMQKTDSLTFVNTATEIICDRQGNYWVSTLDKGIYIIPNKSIKTVLDNRISAGTRVQYLMANSSHLYAAISEGALAKMDQQKHVEFPIRKGSSTGAITGLAFINGKMITNFDATLEWIRNGFPYVSKLTTLEDNSVLAGGNGGFIVYKNNKMLYCSETAVQFTTRVTDICKLSSYKYGIGTASGFYYFNTEGGYILSEEPTLKSIRITACKSLNDSVFAIATRGKGIYLCIKNRFFHIGEAKGLVTDLAEDVYFENDSLFWVGTYKGISKVYFHLSADSLYTHVRCYTKEDGLCSDQVNAIAGFNGYIWLGTNEGLCYFHPSDLRDDTLNIPLSITAVNVNGTKHSIDSLLNLSYAQNNFLIEFNGIYYRAISGVRYKVRLSQQEAWNYTNKNFVEYFNLPPGDYVFEVAAEDKFGKYRSDIHSLHFTVHPRFTDTLLYKAIIGALIFLIIGFLIYLLFSYQRFKSKNVIDLLKSEFKALNYQINPHFIFNVMNSIQYYILRKDTDKAVHFLNSFSMLIRRIVNNSKQQYVSVLEEIESLKEYLDLEKLRLDDKFDYEINIDSKIDIEEKILLPMIIQPLVENSIWHGIVPSDRRGKIKVDFKKEGTALVCVVDDNGVGIGYQKEHKSANHLSMAMSNVQERLRIISELNGSTWMIKAEDKKDLGYDESGTIVTVRFPEIKNDKK